MRAVVGVSCGLSILGTILIILSYILFKKRRTRAREILLHISLMDLGVALANLIGLSVYFDRYYSYHLYVNTSYEVPGYIDGLCKTQAFFAIFCTHASVLWTIALAGFLYFVIVYQKSPIIATYFLRSSYIFCYAVPFLVTMWLVLTKRLGYSPFDSSGWCSLIVTVAFNSEGQSHRQINLVTTIIGYDLWVYLAFVTIPIFYLSIRCHLANMVSAMHIGYYDNYGSAVTVYSITMHSYIVGQCYNIYHIGSCSQQNWDWLPWKLYQISCSQPLHKNQLSTMLC